MFLSPVVAPDMNSDTVYRGQSWPLPARPRPIVIIGSGDIVRDAHLPAYLKAGFPVAGVFDLRREVAEARAQEFDLPRVYESIAEAVAVPDAVFDLGIPPKSQEAVMEQLPDGVPVLSQKPMGNSLDMAKRIVAICERKKLRAAVNFQYRFCPSMLAIRDLLQRGELGELVEIDVRLNIVAPDPGQTIGEGQHDRDEQPAEPEQPKFREGFRQAGLGKIDHQRAIGIGGENAGDV